MTIRLEGKLLQRNICNGQKQLFKTDGEGEIMVINNKMVCRICGADKEMPNFKPKAQEVKEVDWEGIKMPIKRNPYPLNPDMFVGAMTYSFNKLVDLVSELSKEIKGE